MKCVILAGGLGSRLSEETDKKPKPMVDIGGSPIIQHIMHLYSKHGVEEFIVCCGYKGYMIKEYFSNFHKHTSDFSVDLSVNQITMLKESDVKWKLTLIDTGENTQTGGRLRRVRDYIDGTFCMTYGDGLSNVNIKNLISYHKNNSKLATVTAVRPPARFGSLSLNGNLVTEFSEKPHDSIGWINGGFFVLEPEVLDYIKGDETLWEVEPLENLAKDGELCAYFHDGFWRPMDTLRDKLFLEDLWVSGNAPW
jgi:glucose-1-phosphate cytidylyltransferase